MTVAELAAYVASHLRSRGIDVVLSGGSCVSIYCSGKYVSADLDFIDTRFASRRELKEAMFEIGFGEQDRYYSHPEATLLVEFPAGPLAVGKEPVGQIDELEFATGMLRIISPTDCVKDRLAAYYHWKDRQSLEQAVLVAGSQPIDIDEVERWSVSEGMSDKFREISSNLTAP
jgi:hypothetical protein